MRLLIVFAAAILFVSCNSSNTPDVSNIKVNITTERYEKKLFDTTAASLTEYLQKLNSGFTTLYIDTILGLDHRWRADTLAPIMNNVIRAYRDIYNESEKKYSDFTPYENEIKKGLQFTKYYFPDYKLPEKITTFIGPADGVATAVASNTILIGLQNYLGKDFPLYKTAEVQTIYPEYISRRFEPEYISINCMKSIIEDMYPDRSDDFTLVNKMIEKGKRLYILSKLLPAKKEYQLIGYTEKQLEASYKDEDKIWDLFVRNSLLQQTDLLATKSYIDEGPKTQELGEGSPGNIGSFCGWQIVKKYMQQKKDISLSQLMSTDDETIFQEAKYKP
ncbi:hypothetical protein ACQ33O_05530 [Ferruginibacter sp. SUN002]|uniref:gliding motility lipoprotein GldB n=1 Tax=Ferruginibacter sp. SUN002 TaxID=2937789 RepID=UPI003D35AA7E